MFSSNVCTLKQFGSQRRLKCPSAATNLWCDKSQRPGHSTHNLSSVINGKRVRRKDLHRITGWRAALYLNKLLENTELQVWMKLKSLLLRVSEPRSEGKNWRWCGGSKWMRLSTTSWQKSPDCRLRPLEDFSSWTCSGRVTPNCASDNFILKVPKGPTRGNGWLLTGCSEAGKNQWHCSTR